MALSTTEAEYIAATESSKEMIWMKRFVRELGVKQQRFIVYCDIQSAIHLCKNSSSHSRSKHINIRYQWIQEVLDEKALYIKKIHTYDNGSDMMTKSLPKYKHMYFCNRAGLVVTGALP